MRLGPVATKLLAKRAKKKLVAPQIRKAELRLVQMRAPGHAPALAFQRAFGTLRAKEWILGPALCVISFDVVNGKRTLVPVIYVEPDLVFYLDEDGAAWAQDHVEDPQPVRFAENTVALMTKVLVQQHAFECPDAKTLTLPGAQGAAVAKALRAKPIADASDEQATWWTDGTVFIVERDGETRVTHAMKPTLALVRKTLGVASPVKRPVGTTFDEVSNAGGTMCVVIPDLPGTPAENYDSFLPLAKARGKVTALEPGVRIGLDVGGERVDIFFRQPLVSTLMNIYQFTKKRDAAEKAWRAIAEPWAKRR